MNTWSDFIHALGQDENGSVITGLWQRFEEKPVISETPDAYNDPGGKTKYYKFIKSGIELGFRAGQLNHIHFFVQEDEGYSPYNEYVLDRAAHAWTAKNVTQVLGAADAGASAKVDMLIGKVRQWCKYQFSTYDLRMEFSEDGKLWKVTLIAKG